jgi:hypothetical protein
MRSMTGSRGAGVFVFGMRRSLAGRTHDRRPLRSGELREVRSVAEGRVAEYGEEPRARGALEPLGHG